jgi:hypothetical protein
MTVQEDLSTTKTWRWVAAALSLSQLASPLVITRLFGDFLSTGVTNEALITPAGWAFSIWGLITLLSAVTAVSVL